MSVTGIIGTRRLLFVSGWLLLPLACALANRQNPARKVLARRLVLAAIGWTGIVTRRFYAAPDFLEPWPKVARQSARFVLDGGSVVTNSVVVVFYLDRELPYRPPVLDPFYSLDRWDEFRRSQPHKALWVEGIDKTLDQETNAAEAWFRSNCVEVSDQKLVPDSGYGTEG